MVLRSGAVCEPPRHFWRYLSRRQAAGQACVICGRTWDRAPVVITPVGLSVTGEPVWACAQLCSTRAAAIAACRRDDP